MRFLYMFGSLGYCFFWLGSWFFFRSVVSISARIDGLFAWHRVLFGLGIGWAPVVRFAVLS
jgi:hypothetical protein